jgi:hypothetical protein
MHNIHIAKKLTEDVSTCAMRNNKLISIVRKCS